jgi:hypothetical protein
MSVPPIGADLIMPRLSVRREIDGCIVESWRRHEDAEPDVSTERLMRMV